MSWYLLYLLIPGIAAIPILIYHFLIFPNIDGVIQDLDWYNYDDSSQHFMYWLGFWWSGIFGAIFGNSMVNMK